MGFFKVLGGAAIGVAAIVALPVAGPIGAITAVGALVAGGVGAAAGGAASAMGNSEKKASEKKARNDGYNQGKAEGEAKNKARIDKLERRFKQAEQQLKEYNDYTNYLIALSAVGFSCAACDGYVSDTETDEIESFLAGIGFEKLPDFVKQKILAFKSDPPQITTAFELAKKVGLNDDSFKVFEDLIEVAIFADDVEHEKERVFRTAWQALKAA